MAEDDARQGLDLEVQQAGLLLLGESADLLLREADVLEILLRELGQAGLDLALAQPETLGIPAVEAS